MPNLTQWKNHEENSNKKWCEAEVSTLPLPFHHCIGRGIEKQYSW